MKARHTASGFLWEQPSLADLVLGGRLRTVAAIEESLRRLTARFATPITAGQLDRAERALFFSYISMFGEAPPLNLSLAKRWDSLPDSSDLRWAEIGIAHRG